MKSVIKSIIVVFFVIIVYSFIKYLAHVKMCTFMIILFDNVEYILNQILKLMQQPLAFFTTIISIIIISNWKWVQQLLNKKLYLIKQIEIGKNKIIFSQPGSGSTEILFGKKQKNESVQRLDHDVKQELEYIKYMINNMSKGCGVLLNYFASNQTIKDISIIEIVSNIYYNRLELSVKMNDDKIKDLCNAVVIHLISLINTNLISAKIKFSSGIDNNFYTAMVSDISVPQHVKQALSDIHKQGVVFEPNVILK